MHTNPQELVARFIEARDALRAANYDGWYTLEWEKRWHPEIEGPEIAIPAFADFIRALDRD